MLRGRTRTGEGQRLGANYVLVERLGRGAMGDVWRAKERGGPERAIKVLRAELTEDPELVSRFVQERNVLRVRHPHLVPVHDLVVERETLAIVMELVRGHDLRKHLRQHGVLAPAEAVRLLAPVLDALAVVHQEGVVHRDIKPENILLDLSKPAVPRALLTDFGIARVTFGPSLTRLTGLIGTPEYMAPEMADQTEADAGVDLYAFGCVLYEVVAGRSPFAGGNPVAVLRRHMDEAPQRPAGVPDALWPVLEALLSKDPAQRPTASDAAAWLRRVHPVLEGSVPTQPLPPVEPLADRPTVERLETPVQQTELGGRRAPQVEQPVEPPRKGWLRPLVLGPALTALLGLVAVAALVLPGEDAPPVVQAVPAAAVQQLTMAPVAYQDGLVVTRRWELSADRQRLRAVLGLHNSGSRPLTGRLTEKLPEVFGDSMLRATYRQKPTVLGKDAVAFYGFDRLLPGRYVPVEYVVPAPQQGDLSDWAGAFVALRNQGATPPRELLTLTLPVEKMSLPVGKALRLPLDGTLDDGSKITPPVLSGLVWTSSDPAVATVDAGRVVALTAGSTTIEARGGSVVANVDVTVVRQGEPLVDPAPAEAPRPARLLPQPAALLGPGKKPAPVKKPVVVKPTQAPKPAGPNVAPKPAAPAKQPVARRTTPARQQPAPVRTRARSNTGTQQQPARPRPTRAPQPVNPEPEPEPVDPQPEAEPVEPQPE